MMSDHYDRYNGMENLLSTNLAEVGTDYISRQQAIDALGELPTFTQDWSYNTWMYTDDVYNAIKELPPIQPKRGKWIEIEAFSDCRYVKCDQCKTVEVFYYGKRNTNFCPHCGAKMEANNEID